MQGAIFDLDGTLLNSMGLWRHAGEIYLKNLGITAEEGLADTILKMTIRGAAQYLIERYSLPCSVEEAAGGINGVMESAYATVITPKEGAEQLLQALFSRGIPMAVATATDRYLVEIALGRLGLIKYFKGIVTCTEVGVGKRDGADVYEAALKLTGSAKGIHGCLKIPPTPRARQEKQALWWREWRTTTAKTTSPSCKNTATSSLQACCPPRACSKK